MATPLEQCKQFTRELLTQKQAHLIYSIRACNKKKNELKQLRKSCKETHSKTEYCSEHWQYTLDLRIEEGIVLDHKKELFNSFMDTIALDKDPFTLLYPNGFPESK